MSAAVGTGEPGELTRVRRDQRGRLARQQVAVRRQHGQAVRVDENRQVGAEHRPEQLGGIIAGAHAGTGHPGLHAAGRGEKVLRRRAGEPVAAPGGFRREDGDHGLRPPLPHDLHRRLGGDEPDHPRAAADGAADGQHGRAGEAARCRRRRR